ncbi:MAG: chromosome segregation protein SMC [Candidatus Kerfeldbacteria bacterium]|nr:chromosome segregation protein SMC [Candidatus Kerfeldbacteria bacterium]
MYLQRLVIQGFKSFANKTTLEFKPGITAIVGPNGSGKSNTADAVRWVLGEQSLKSIRGKKSGDVIFAGSDKKTRLGYCQVDMILNNEDRKAPIDYSEVVITRKMSRDGEGEYYINKNRVRLHDILLLLAKSNFGQRTYSIIGQGTVDAFLAASPTQRKEYFDEAAGVRQFQIKKEQAENKLNLTRENLQQAELLIQEIEPRVRSLTRQVHRLEKREEVLKELKGIQHTYYTGTWNDLQRQHATQDEKFQKTDAARAKLEQDMRATEQEMQELAGGSSRQDRFSELQRRYAEIIAEKNRLLRDQASLKGRIDSARHQSGDVNTVWLERRQEQLTGTQSSLEAAVTAAHTEVTEQQMIVAAAEKKCQTLESDYRTTSERLTAAKDELTTSKAITVPEIATELELIYDRQKTLLEHLQATTTPDDLRSLTAEAQALSSQIAQLRHKVQKSGTGDPLAVMQLQESITTILREKESATHTLTTAQVKLHVAQEKEAMLQGQYGQTKSELETVTKEIERSGQSSDSATSSMQTELKDLQKKVADLDAQLNKINAEFSGFNEQEQAQKEKVFALQQKLHEQQQSLNAITTTLGEIRVELAKLETRQEDLEREMVDELSDEERDAIYATSSKASPQPELFNDIQKLKKQLELIGGIDTQVAEEYQQSKERYDFLTHQSNDLNAAIADLEKIIAELDETIKAQFTKAFEQISKQFTEYFKILFKGGNASLSLVKEELPAPGSEIDDEDAEEAAEDDEDAEEAAEPQPAQKGTGEKVVTGIDIHATPPGKRLRGISMLSGGERAMTSIALLCAIIHNNPSPFVILDEVDAALDESNSLRFASIVERLSSKTQFIIITHNRATMNKARILYGVTMGDDGVSKLLSMNMEQAEKIVNR